MTKFILSSSVILMGVLMLIYTRQFKSFTGNIGWAEKFLGSGGTYSALKLIGFLLILFGIMYLTGTFDQVMINFIAPFFGGNTNK